MASPTAPKASPQPSSEGFKASRLSGERKQLRNQLTKQTRAETQVHEKVRSFGKRMQVQRSQADVRQGNAYDEMHADMAIEREKRSRKPSETQVRNPSPAPRRTTAKINLPEGSDKASGTAQKDSAAFRAHKNDSAAFRAHKNDRRDPCILQNPSPAPCRTTAKGTAQTDSAAFRAHKNDSAAFRAHKNDRRGPCILQMTHQEQSWQLKLTQPYRSYVWDGTKSDITPQPYRSYVWDGTKGYEGEGPPLFLISLNINGLGDTDKVALLCRRIHHLKLYRHRMLAGA